jgi:hypothetical protein
MSGTFRPGPLLCEDNIEMYLPEIISHDLGFIQMSKEMGEFIDQFR